METMYFGYHGPSAPLATPMGIISIFLICSPCLCWVFNSNVTTKFVQLQYINFYHKVMGRQKILFTPLFKVGDMSLPGTQSLTFCIFC